MAGLLDLIAERQKTLSAARPNSIAGLLAESGVRPGENLASMAQQYISTLPQKTQANLAYQMSLLDKAYPGDTYQSMMTQGDPKALAELAMQAPYNAMIAYHGTPHNILGKFDISKVGTGEGAQAYGHGMYFAENPAVAKEYQDFLGKKISVGGTPIYEANKRIGKTGDSLVDDMIVANLGDIDKAIKFAKEGYEDIISNNPNGGKDFYNAWKKLEEYKKAGQIETKSTGNLYKVDIPDEYIPNMLDWDKPLSKMTKKEAEIIEPLKNKLISQKNPYYPDSFETIGQVIQFSRGSNPNLEKELLEAGIPGIKYLDEGSRGKGQGTRNFVVFDPSEVKILEKNSKKVEGLLSE